MTGMRPGMDFPSTAAAAATVGAAVEAFTPY